METIKDRILVFLGNKKITKSAFEIAVGLSNGYMNSLRHSPKNEKIMKILETYPELNKIWLLSGDGEMFNKKDSVEKDNLLYEISCLKKRVAFIEQILKNNGLMQN